MKGSTNLTDPDKDRVLKSVAEGLRSKVSEGSGGPFETRSTALETSTGVPLRKGFDLLAVEDMFANKSATEIQTLRAQAEAAPF